MILGDRFIAITVFPFQLARSTSVHILADLSYWWVHVPIQALLQTVSQFLPKGVFLLHSLSIHGKVVNVNVLIVYQKAQTDSEAAFAAAPVSFC